MNRNRISESIQALAALALLMGPGLVGSSAVLGQSTAAGGGPTIPLIHKAVISAAGPQSVKPDDDQYEPNDTADQAASIQAGQYDLQGWDQDWFVFEVPADAAITVTIEGPQGDLDLFLFDASGNDLAGSFAYGSYESVSGTVASGTYTIAVNPYEDQGSSYVLTLVVPEPESEEPEASEESNDGQEPDESEESDQPDPPAAATGYGLLVGIDHYDPYYGAGSLPSCINDANGMHKLLTGDASGRWAAENVQLLTDGQATKSAIRSALQSLAARTGPGDVVVYFHSSHGGQTSGTETYLCTYDASYTDAELGSDLSLFHSDAKVIVIVDACHSGGLFKDAGWPLAKRIMKAYKAKRAARLQARGVAVPKDLGANIAFMTACNYDQTCAAGDVYSLYTEYLIKTCSVASADTSGDGNYQFWEMYDYAAAEASKQDPNQTAQYYNQDLLARTIVRTGPAGGEQVASSSLPPLVPTCGAGATEALTIGLFGLLSIAAPSRRRWTYRGGLDGQSAGRGWEQTPETKRG